jgi:hypothetical protein
VTTEPVVEWGDVKEIVAVLKITDHHLMVLSL